MCNPYLINVQCDGAMNYDKNQTGGNGFHIEFPESINLPSIDRYFRNDKQGIHRIEMISILEAIEELLIFNRKNPGILCKAAGVRIYTDRYNATDDTQLNRLRIKEYRKNDWNNHEGKPIKNKDLIEQIDKKRGKLEQEVRGRVEIKYHSEKKNKIADGLSKKGRLSDIKGRLDIKKKRVHIARRKLDGSEINYSILRPKDHLCIHVYKWEMIKDQYEIIAEIINGTHKGKTIKIYIDSESKDSIHLNYSYGIKIKNVYKYHILIDSFKDLKSDIVVNI